MLILYITKKKYKSKGSKNEDRNYFSKRLAGFLKQQVIVEELRQITIEELKQELVKKFTETIELFNEDFCLALSGGLDSSVLAVLLEQEIKSDFF